MELTSSASHDASIRDVKLCSNSGFNRLHTDENWHDDNNDSAPLALIAVV